MARTTRLQSSKTSIMTSEKWSFMDSDLGASGIHGPDIQLGSMAFVRKGETGILLVFGGYDTHRGTEFKNFDWDRRPMDQIFIYDIQTNVWYLQEATGDIP
ncbi:putative Kelch repeat protein [Seiridium cardinale]|uniref:Kelch repeat protein n=1 Tax=Seiridium cardinale TaxID=138064 RepID=A0ABR2XCE6_9PEZI